MSGGDRGDIEAGKRSRSEGDEQREVKQSAFEGGDEEKIDSEGQEVEGRSSKTEDSGGENTEGTKASQQEKQQQAAVPTERIVVSDPISESYRSIVEVINRTSDGFREGKKWKCVAGTPIRAAENQRQQHQQQSQYAATTKPRGEQRRSKKHRRMTRSHTAEEGARGGGGAKRLVRQTACAAEDSGAQSVSAGNVCLAESQRLLSPPSAGAAAAHPRGRMTLPVRQWTVDASCPPALGQAYLLRPVSRGSIKSSASGGGGGADDAAGSGARRLSPGDMLFSSACGRAARGGARSPMLERVRAASFNVETDGGGGATVSIRSSRSGSGKTTLSAPNRYRVKKQKTCDSGGGGSHAAAAAKAIGGSNRHLPRQFSNASAYSAAAAFVPTSFSHQGMTLVRGASCSLVDIPTYLGPSYGGVELAQICDVRMAAGGETAPAAGATVGSASAPCAANEPSAGAAVDLSQQRKSARPRLQVKLLNKCDPLGLQKYTVVDIRLQLW